MRPLSWLTLLLAGGALSATGLLGSGLAQAHGGLSIDNDPCKLTVGPYRIHFTSYQPLTTQQKAFCEVIPGIGETIILFDYVEQELRSLPVEVRIVKDTGTNDNPESVTVLHLPSQVYANGHIDLSHTFEQPGQFIAIVTVIDTKPYVSRFPFSIGEQYGTQRSDRVRAGGS